MIPSSRRQNKHRLRLNQEDKRIVRIQKPDRPAWEPSESLLLLVAF